MFDSRRYPSRATGIALVSVAACVGLGPAASRAQDAADFTAVAISEPPAAGAPLRVIVTWPDAAAITAWSAVRGYNLYRKVDLAAPYPRHPVNGRPLEPLESCDDLLATLGGGEEWSLVEKALADVPADGRPRPFDPCRLGTVARGTPKHTILQWLVRARWKIAVAAGQGFEDRGLIRGRTYYYELRGLDGRRGEIVLDTDIAVTAGAPTALAAPTGLAAEAGDSKVLLTWGDRPHAAGFNVYRSTTLGGPYYRVNTAAFAARVGQTLRGEPIVAGDPQATVNGFLDFQHWDASGNPQAGPTGLEGPHNALAYFYQVAAVDALGGEGPTSAAVSVTPRDTTPPDVPGELQVTVYGEEDRIEVRWVPVTRDEARHPEVAYNGAAPLQAPVPGVEKYRVYRYDSSDDPDPSLGTLVAEIAGPAAFPVPQLITQDDDVAALRPAFGDRTFWYRVVAIDERGNASAFSGAAAAILQDNTPPATPTGLLTTGLEGAIEITWDLNTELDLDGYLVFRSLCHLGGWPCRDPGEPPDLPRDGPDDCSNAWSFIGYVDHDDVEDLGTGLFEDHSLPEGSPLCYAYLVKAIDEAQNMSGRWPIRPDAEPAEPYLCQRLRDTTPPEPAVITALKARDGKIEISWIGPPVQDIAGYHVYRAESESGEYEFVGGRTVAKLPGDTAVDLDRPVPETNAGCTEIPLVPYELMSAGTYVDDGRGPASPPDPKRIYWYKVVGADESGNEADRADAVPVSTFTFSTAVPATPTVTAVTVSEAPCGLVVTWSPAFDPGLHRGFGVFRARSAAGPFRQIGSLVAGASEYTDTRVRRGVTYWYRVLAVGVARKLSRVSAATSGVVP